MNDVESYCIIRVPRGEEWYDTTVLDRTLGQLVINRELLEEDGIDASLPAMIELGFSSQPKGMRMLLDRASWQATWNDAKAKDPDAESPIWRYPVSNL